MLNAPDYNIKENIKEEKKPVSQSRQSICRNTKWNPAAFQLNLTALLLSTTLLNLSSKHKNEQAKGILMMVKVVVVRLTSYLS